ncbi:hypothetical protein AZE42_06962 [Rhizopogon vesiculosus]|uniref:Uncharacterized protein n=1 Tax=Rhizopogon vesiculosus TaxID=180088 RepID=A0A1J8QGV0_9AGAM|nr:hypothetical protein AZE42_06962 [Rhizopogon vesiculosus]
MNDIRDALGSVVGWLQKSHATSAERQNWTPYARSAMNDIRDTLDGTVTLRANLLPPARRVTRTLKHICGRTRILASRLQIQNVLLLRRILRSLNCAQSWIRLKPALPAVATNSAVSMV